MKTSEAEKKRFAAASHGFNLANKKFRDVFPEVCSSFLYVLFTYTLFNLFLFGDQYATPELTDLPDMGNGPTAEKEGPGSNVCPTFPSWPFTRPVLSFLSTRFRLLTLSPYGRRNPLPTPPQHRYQQTHRRQAGLEECMLILLPGQQ